MSSEVLISIKNLCKQFNQFTAVKDLDLTVYKGDVYGFLGPNGAGKSTTIRMLMGLIHPTSGTIEIYGKHLKEERSFILSSIGAIIEKPDFYNYLSGIQNLELLNKMQPKQASRDDLYRLLELVGLKGREKSKVKTYSQGMKQRLGFAQALMHNPDLIVLDEPTNGLDPQGVKDVRDLIIKLNREEGKTILISSHILSEIEIICNRMIIIQKGSRIVEGSVDELLNNNELHVTFEFDNHNSVLQFITQHPTLQSKFIEVVNNRFHFNLLNSEVASVNKLFIENGFAVKSLIPMRSLEDYFLNLT
ncbi:MAG: ABC transporter ATP-binding protein [Bacteroidota bacterium]